jgi:type III pantothenate kinase
VSPPGRAASGPCLLALDAGNTAVGVGVFRGADRVAAFRVPLGTGAELVAAVREGLAGVGALGAWEGAVLASVVPSRDQDLTALCRAVTGMAPVVIDHTSDLGITIATRAPAAVGADRLANGAAAFLLYGGPVVVADAGTALSVTAVTADGRYVGGAIAPGPAMALEALASRAERLPEVALAAPDGPIGADTPAAMRAGAVIGTAGMLDRLVGETVRALGGGPATTVCLTGGYAALLGPYLTVPHRLEDHLTLTGLMLLYGRARRAAARP